MIIKPKCGMFKGMFKGMGLCSADKVVSAGGGPSYLLSESFEGTGYENVGWTESGSGVNEDYTTSPLDGSQSLRCYYSGGNSYTKHSFTPQDTVYIYFMFKTIETGSNSGAILFRLMDEAETQTLIRISTDAVTATNYDFYVIDNSAGGGDEIFTDLDLAEGTAYHIWLKYIKGTGSNSTVEIYVSANATKPGTPTGSFSGGDGTTQAGKIVLGVIEATAGDENWVYDKIRVSETDIGSNPD